jgi:hypothetical protein
MGVGYNLVNFTKKEMVGFIHVSASKKHELAGNPAASAITTWYLLENAGDKISFVSDTNEDWPFPEGSKKDLLLYPDVTDRVIDALIANGILSDQGRNYVDPDEPDTVYERDLCNIWCSDDSC